MYAVVETGAKQYKVTPGDTLEVERLQADQGNTVTLDRVLLVNKEGQVTVGMPTVTNASVVLIGQAHSLLKRVLTFR
jgi:large subunit ribosomal protein L21